MSASFNPALGNAALMQPPQALSPQTSQAAGQQAGPPASTSPQAPSAQPGLSPGLSIDQKREIFRDKMIQKLQQQATPPKNKGEAVLRNILDGPMLAMDTVLGGALWGAGMIAKKAGWLNIQRPWLAMAFPVIGIIFRAGYSAITGKVPAQQSAERSLKELGLPNPQTAPTQTPMRLEQPPGAPFSLQQQVSTANS